MRTGWVVVVIAIWLMGTLSVAADESSAPVSVAWLTPNQGLQATEQLPRPLLDQFASTYTSPRAIATFLRTAFTFRRDTDLFGKMDYWQSPEEFARRKAGDCEDYALFAKALLNRNGIEAYVLSLFGIGDYAHTVCVFVDERGRYNLIDERGVRVLHAKSLPALASWLYPGWTLGAIMEQAGTRGRIVKKIMNPSPAYSFAFTDPLSNPFSSF